LSTAFNKNPEANESKKQYSIQIFPACSAAFNGKFDLSFYE